MVFDPEKKFVRVAELRADGFVEFDFAIGEPALFVELILPTAAFDEFCASNAVSFLPRRAAERDDASPQLRAAARHRLTP